MFILIFFPENDDRSEVSNWPTFREFITWLVNHFDNISILLVFKVVL